MSDVVLIVVLILSAPVWVPLLYFVALLVIGLFASMIGGLICAVVLVFEWFEKRRK